MKQVSDIGLADVQKTIFDMDLMTAMGEEMVFMQNMACEGKLIKGRFIARKSR